MSILNSVLTKVFGNKSDKDIKKINPIVEEINSEYSNIQNLTDDELKLKFSKIQLDLSEIITSKESELKEKDFKNSEINKELESIEKQYLDDNMNIVFAIVKDAARRLSDTKFKVMNTDMIWNMVHYDVQLIGGVVLHQGKISEMKTGEGKTLVSTLAIVLNGITKRGVHVVTVNDYLAQRDSEWMGLLYNFLGLSVGCLLDRMSPLDRKEAYNKDITIRIM